jgi:hypothetical protein
LKENSMAIEGRGVKVKADGGGTRFKVDLIPPGFWGGAGVGVGLRGGHGKQRRPIKRPGRSHREMSRSKGYN